MVFVTRHVLVNWVYAGAMGEAVEFHLLNTTLEPSYVFRYLPKVLLVYVLFYVLGVRQWRRLNRLFKGATLMFAAQLVLGAVVGVIDEVRQYSELYGLGAVLAGVALLPTTEALPEFRERSSRGRRIVVGMFSLMVLIVIATSSHRHWRDSLSSLGNFERIELRDNPALSRQKRDGEAWNAPGNYVFRNQLPAVFLIDGPREVSFVDIGLDGNDEYRVALKTDVKVKEYTLQPLGRNGIQRRRLVAPPGVLLEIRVFPIAGDGHFAVGYIVVSR